MVAGIVGGYLGFWVAHLAGWSGTARWPLDPRGGGGTILVVAAFAAFAAVTAGIALNLIPTFAYRNAARTGILANATIAEAWRTGATSHDMGEVLSEYGLKLEVRPPGGTPYSARTKRMVATADEATYLPGNLVVVRFDPGFPRKVFVVGPVRKGSGQS